MKKLYFSLFIIYIIVGCSDNTLKVDDSDKRVKIYSIPFSIETYAPITLDNIEVKHERYGEINIENKNFNAFLKSIESMPKVDLFKSKRVRVKLVMPNKQTIYIDKDGFIITNSSISKMTKKVLDKIKKMVYKNTNYLDKNSSTRFELLL